MQTSKTDKVAVRFYVKEYGDGTPWLLIETEKGKPLPAIGDGFQGFDLKDGTTYEEAKEVARVLNRFVSDMSHTWFVPEHMQEKPF